MDWKKYETVYYRMPNIKLPKNVGIAGFDLDSTLIISDRGEIFANKGWLWAYDKIPETLKDISDKNYVIVIFSNRKNSYNIDNTMSFIDQIINQTQLPIYAFLSTGVDRYRKPNIGMLQLFMFLNNIETIDKNSLYCGDASGPEDPDPSFQWANSDRKFAENSNLIFYVPTQIFQKFTPIIPPNIKLLITVGHGWENLFLLDSIIENKYVVVSNPHLYINNEVQIIIGENPTFKERNNLREKTGVSINDTLILYFPNFGQYKLSKENRDYYIKNCKIKENYIRMN